MQAVRQRLKAGDDKILQSFEPHAHGTAHASSEMRSSNKGSIGLRVPDEVWLKALNNLIATAWHY
jgi:hypothetical protein